MQDKINEIQQIAKDLTDLHHDKNYLFERLNNLDQKTLVQLINEYESVKEDFKPVNLVRYKVLKTLNNKEKVDENYVDLLKDKIRNKDTDYFAHPGDELIEGLKKYPKQKNDIFTKWNSPFRIFYSFFYYGDLSEKISSYLEDIAEDVKQKLNLKDLNHFISDFNGTQNSGTMSCWMSLYPAHKSKHTKGSQLLLDINYDKLIAGLIPGSETTKEHKKELSKLYSYEEVLDKLMSVKDKFLELNKKPRNFWKYLLPGETLNWDEMYKKGIMAIGWDELGDITNKTIDDLNNSGNPEIQNAIKNWNIIQNFRDASIGDVVIAEKDMVNVYGIGVITSQYYFDDTRKHFKHVRKVKWLINKLIDFEEPIFGPDTFSRTKKWKEIKDKYSVLNDQYEEIIKDIEKGNISIFDHYNYLSDPDKPFIPYEKVKDIERALEMKKNIVLQGPPGTGKTFIAKKIAYDFMGRKDDSKIEMIQFHQSYSYEDFIQGIRPDKDGFRVKNGVFYNFCKKAERDKDNPYFFIIDEINRGNLSKIFGELMMLIENDKRGDQYSIPLTYSESQGERFSVPENVYIIGTMNTADRSLAIVDYALRRRFDFITIYPQFNEAFKKYLTIKNINPEKVDRLMQAFNYLNKIISEDKNLGKGFQIGHSYFCNNEINPSNFDQKYKHIIEYEIGPLLEEYWFDNLEKVKSEKEDLLKS